MQLAVGVGVATSRMIAAFGNDIVKEHELAICDIAFGGTLNFVLVYLLKAVAPAVAYAPSSSSQLCKKSRVRAAAPVPQTR